MAVYIIQVEVDKKKRYAEWSTVTTELTTKFMLEKKLREYYRKQYGVVGMSLLQSKINRANKTGCSAYDMNIKKVLEASGILNPQALFEKYR